MNLRQAAQQALEFLSHDMVAEDWPHQKRKDAVCDALRAALAEPEQKGWFTVEELNEWATKLPQTTHWEGCEAVHPECRKPEQEPIGHADLGINNIYIFSALEPRVIPVGRTPLYTAPAPRKPLSDEEIRAVYGDDLKYRDGDYLRFARAIERAHGITGEQT